MKTATEIRERIDRLAKSYRAVKAWDEKSVRLYLDLHRVEAVLLWVTGVGHWPNRLTLSEVKRVNRETQNQQP